jgi:hypothetical protein
MIALLGRVYDRLAQPFPASAARIVRSPLFWTPAIVVPLVYAVAGPYPGRWVVTVISAPLTVGSAAVVRGLYRSHPLFGAFGLLALTLLFLVLLFFHRNTIP